jgi:hypothetical protein
MPPGELMPKTRQQKRAHVRRPAPKRKRSSSGLFAGTMIALIIGGGAAAYVSVKHPPPLTRGAAVGEHWHATYRIYICGLRMTNYPTVEGEIHSHGDGFIHIHPATQAFAGPNANLGNFLRLYETTLGRLPNGKTQVRFPDGLNFTDGDACPNDHKHYDVVLTNKGKKVKGDPGLYTPHDGDQLVLSFGPEGTKLLPNPYSLVHHIPDAGIAGSQIPSDVATPVPTQRPTSSP